MSSQPKFQPAPGFILAKPMSVEELKSQDSTSLLSLPDSASKEKDSVGIARVVAMGGTPLEVAVAIADISSKVGVDQESSNMWSLASLKPGDLIAYIPYTDAIIMVGIEKHNLVPYRNVMAVMQG